MQYLCNLNVIAFFQHIEESASDPSKPMVSAKLPIRKVLDIFQELKLNFGRGT